jgi:hypothetical protein
VTIYVEEDGHTPSTREFRLRFGLFQPSQVLRDALYRAWLRRQHEATRPSVSMGPLIDRRDIPVGQSGGVSQVHTEPTQSATVTSTGQGTGINQTPHQSVLPGATPSVLPQQTSTGGSDMALDLGAILVDLGKQYIDARWGTPAYEPWMSSGAGVSTTPAVVYENGVGTDIIPRRSTPVFLGAATGVVGKIAGILGGLGLGLAADDIAVIAKNISKVKCKRRRRRLATHSDIKDLAALSAVLGKGKLLETWVATRRI